WVFGGNLVLVPYHIKFKPVQYGGKMDATEAVAVCLPGRHLCWHAGCAAEGAVVTDYDTTGPISALLSMPQVTPALNLPQPVSFWEVFVPALAEMLRLHSRAMLFSSKANEARLKDMFDMLKRLIVKPEFVRKRALLQVDQAGISDPTRHGD
ncbi:unnamed protein product, partial [Closterium sp. NIES-64]